MTVTSLTIHHNPRCSKSRRTLNLLEGRGLSPEIVLYLEAPPWAVLPSGSWTSSSPGY